MGYLNLGLVTAAVLATAALASHDVAAQEAPDPIEVDLEMVLAVDVSGSVSPQRFQLQRDGWANAFRTASVQDAINDGTRGQIAATLVYWSSSRRQVNAVDWRLIDDGSGGLTASQFGDLIADADRPFRGGTGVGPALEYSINEIQTNNFDGDRQVIDISGDGTNNIGVFPTTPRDEAEQLGITINGLAIEEATRRNLTEWYADNVITSDGFAVTAATFADIEGAALDKLEREIRIDPIDTDPIDVPVPGTAILFLAGLIGLAGVRRRFRA